MTREEAAREIDNTACCFSDKRFRDAMHMAADSLRQSAWVRTADRVPEGNDYDMVLAHCQGGHYKTIDIIAIGWIKQHPEMHPHWQYLPPLPENAGVEGTKINGGE